MTSYFGYAISAVSKPERVPIADDRSSAAELMSGYDVTSTPCRIRVRRNCSVPAAESRRKKMRLSNTKLSTSPDETVSVLDDATTAARIQDTTVSGSLPARRLLMCSWLILKANDSDIDNISWHDDEHTQLRILWKHGSKSNWSVEDSRLFLEWAQYTGKYHGSKSVESQSKKWKANFRCALNSLSDVTEVKSKSQRGGNNPYKVYQINRQQKEVNDMINSAKTVKRCQRSKKRNLTEMKTSTRALEETGPDIDLHSSVAPLRQKPHPVRSSSNCRQRSDHHVSNERTSVPDATLPLPVVEFSLSYPVIPTVVEEMALDDADEMALDELSDEMSNEDSLSDHLDDVMTTSHRSTSPGSSGYNTDSYICDNYLDQDPCFQSPVTFIAAELNIEETHGYQENMYADLPSAILDDEFDLFDVNQLLLF